jgi:hypothetical protein
MISLRNFRLDQARTKNNVIPALGKIQTATINAMGRQWEARELHGWHLTANFLSSKLALK